jgi:transcriptional regulator with XRE-family HTH domain
MRVWLICIFMTKEEFKAALKRLSISQRKFAAETGMSISAVNEWATGRAKMPPIAVSYILLRLWLEGKPTGALHRVKDMVGR